MKAVTSTWGKRSRTDIKWSKMRDFNLSFITRQCVSARGAWELPGELLKPTNTQEPPKTRQIRIFGVGATYLKASWWTPTRRQRTISYSKAVLSKLQCAHKPFENLVKIKVPVPWAWRESAGLHGQHSLVSADAIGSQAYPGHQGLL